MLSALKRWWADREERQRLERHIRKCGFVTFCSRCRSPHLGYATEISRYVVQYECAECAQLDRFEFGIYPFPVRVESSESDR